MPLNPNAGAYSNNHLLLSRRLLHICNKQNVAAVSTPMQMDLHMPTCRQNSSLCKSALLPSDCEGAAHGARRLSLIILSLGFFAESCCLVNLLMHIYLDDMDKIIPLFWKMMWVMCVRQWHVRHGTAFLQARSEACMVIAGWWWHATPSF